MNEDLKDVIKKSAAGFGKHLYVGLIKFSRFGRKYMSFMLKEHWQWQRVVRNTEGGLEEDWKEQSFRDMFISHHVLVKWQPEQATDSSKI